MFITILFLKYLKWPFKSRIAQLEYSPYEKMRDIISIVEKGKPEAKEMFLTFMEENQPITYEYLISN